MALSRMPSALLYTLLLVALRRIIPHELCVGTYVRLWDEPLEFNFTAGYTINVGLKGSAGFQAAGCDDEVIADYDVDYDVDSAVTTTGGYDAVVQKDNATAEEACYVNGEAFYRGSLPRDLLIVALLLPLQFCWYVGLDRLLPTWRHTIELSSRPSAHESAADESGPVRRELTETTMHTHFSWCNALLKWILDITAGSLCFEALKHLLSGLLQSQGWEATLEGLKWHTQWSWLCSFASAGPLAMLLGRIMIPADRLVVFQAGVDLGQYIVFIALVKVLVGWLLEVGILKWAVENVTEAAAWDAEPIVPPRLIDEL